MARIYYKEENLGGLPFKHPVINTAFFDFIFSNSNATHFEFTDTQSSFLYGIFKRNKPIFKNVFLSNDGIHYQASEGDFYLPVALIFCDLDDYPFPTEYYFIAKINDEIELRKCNAGAGIKWFQTADKYKSVNDTAILAKIENTLLELKKCVETTNNKQNDLELARIEVAAKQNKQFNLPPLSIAQKEGYQQLTALCLHNTMLKEDVFAFIATLKDYNLHEDFTSTLNVFMMYLEDCDINFIMRFDWKVDPEDVEWLLDAVVKENYPIGINLPTLNDYKESTSHSAYSIFEYFDIHLRKQGLQLSLIDTQSDEYIVILHLVEAQEEIKKAIQKIGYDYAEINRQDF